MTTTLSSETLNPQNMASGSSSNQIGKRSIASLAPLSAMSSNNPSGLRDSTRNTNRYSVTQLYSMAAENDTEIEDELARAQKRLRDLKTKISSQSKKNFVLERDRMALGEREEVREHLEEADESEGLYLDEKRTQSCLHYIGNQYENREEHLLLTMFQHNSKRQPISVHSLRANTPVSRMMTTYTRRGPGQSYLKTVLAERINSLIEHKDLNLEINPLKVYDQMIQQIEDETGSLPEDLPRGFQLNFLMTIMESIDSVPYGIRWICKQIRSLTKRKYQEATDIAICSLIGGFFFLRFINPAIVTPQAYMLIDNLPTTAKYPRRTLTLIAKMLQNLANKPSYSKEAYMMSLNPFVESNKARINKFLNLLCEVKDFYESLEMDQYMALSKKDLQINITLNELYNTHSLLVFHLDHLAKDERQHLRILLEEIGPAPAQVPRKENRTIELPLYSRWEIPIQDITTALMAENNLTQNDILYMETKSIFVQLIRSIPQLTEKRPMNLLQIAERAATAKDAVLVRKGLKVKEMLRELEEIKLSEKKDGHKLLVDEISAELTHLGNMREKVIIETKSLESVYKTIGDHNNYLRSQLEQYKAYLQNVRITSTANQKGKIAGGGVGVVSVDGKEKNQGVIVDTNVPENRRANIFFQIVSPSPGTFIIALHYKGREKAILEMDLKIDDLLEKQKDNVPTLDLEYVQLSVPKTLAMLNKTFARRK
ncbi:hypothetical protein PSTT_01017 [Puccinia striiformis]|uniref:Ras-GAP domain-containing protein n=1 Tax=Puccinia striiformis TaxID=27350 RepID=A0A2S4W4V9_9BASI|nr:hypothetical protein PSTT_01017 [Puccinia striiformis]